MKRTAVVASLLVLLILALMAMKGQLLSLPAPQSATGFDTARAAARLQRILGDEAPHPVDSAGADSVRARILAELAAMGLRAAVTDGMACNGSANDRGVSCARIRNILVTIGPREGRHVLLVSHYDSTPVGPGASDDGIGVAAMLEAAAVLKDAPLGRPVTFLFNEGEEAGLIGARAFLDRNPLAARVDTLVNLESRGVTGPAIMFETSRPNAPAITHFRRAAERPVANSLTTDFYRLVPNSTDVSVFNERDWTILNFAIIGNEARYHTPGDTLGALDRRSLAHMGAQAIAVTRELASGPAKAAPGERIYADLVGRKLIVLPQAFGIVLIAILLLFFALAARGRPGVPRGAGVMLLAIADAALAVFLMHSLIGWVRPGEFWRAQPELMAFAVDATALASAAGALLWLAAPVGREALRRAFWLVFLLLGAAISVAAPGAMIFFLLPPLVAALGMVAGRRVAGAERVAALIAWALLFMSFAPLLDLSQTLLDFDSAWTFAPLAALILIPVLIELKPLLASLPSLPAAAALVALALFAWLPTALAPAYSLDRKQRMSLEYSWDAQKGSARWMIYHDGADLPAPLAAAAGPVERRVEVPWSGYRRWAAPARGPAVEAPRIEKLAERIVPGGRLVSLRLDSGGSDVVRLRMPPEARVRAVRAGSDVQRFGRGAAKDPYVFRCHGRSCDGLRFDLLVGSGAPVEATLVGMRPGLPGTARPLLEARPTTAHAQYGPDATYVIDRVRL